MEDTDNFGGKYDKLVCEEDFSTDEHPSNYNQEKQQDSKLTEGHQTIAGISNEVAKLQATYNTAIQSRDEAKKQLVKEISEQQLTKWELEHQNRRRNDYEKQINKIKTEIAVLKSHLPMINHGRKPETSARSKELTWQ
ncbi:hypothetical protein EXN66_Car016957 [Channa argus]|uniref:Uncharacterized protein n=1 Tax=Channa argus TaxID=215402 RepID=A0A6G1QFV4_CHAAH|nr:hypothetical protein EXN66_Car016957 [Channa argus]